MPLAVRCVRMDHGRAMPLPHSECWPAPRPGPREDCSSEPCPARWAPSRGAGSPGRGPWRCRQHLPATARSLWGFHGTACKARAPGPGVPRARAAEGSFFHHLLFTKHLRCPGAVPVLRDTAGHKTDEQPCPPAADCRGQPVRTEMGRRRGGRGGRAAADAASGGQGPGRRWGACGRRTSLQDPLRGPPLPHCLLETSGIFSPSATLSIKWVLRNVLCPLCQAFHWRRQCDPPREPLQALLGVGK